MHYSEIISIVALGLCSLLGLGALFAPAWAADIVRLTEDPDPAKPGGYSEFRATYGGMILFLHLMAIALLLAASKSDSAFLSLMVVLPIAAGWIGAAVGRTASMLLDKDKNRTSGKMPIWILTELVTGLAIAAPFLQFIV